MFRNDVDGLGSFEIGETIEVKGIEISKGNIVDSRDFKVLQEPPILVPFESQEDPSLVYLGLYPATQELKGLPENANAVLYDGRSSKPSGLNGKYTVVNLCHLEKLTISDVRRL